MKLETVPLNESYAENGYVTNVSVYSEDEINNFRKNFDELESRFGKEKCQVGLIDWHFIESFVWDIATGSKVLDAIQEVMGKDLLLLGTHFFCKYPEKAPKSFVAWHQDVTYWGLEPSEAHTAWIALDDADEDNGSMLLIPGSHKQGQLPHETSNTGNNLLSINQQVSQEFIDESKAVQLELKAGEMSIHHGYLLHSSMSNGSGRRRCGLTVRFIPPYVKQVMQNSVGKRYSPILLRGSDYHHHFHETKHPYPLIVQ